MQGKKIVQFHPISVTVLLAITADGQLVSAVYSNNSIQQQKVLLQSSSLQLFDVQPISREVRVRRVQLVKQQNNVIQQITKEKTFVDSTYRVVTAQPGLGRQSAVCEYYYDAQLDELVQNAQFSHVVGEPVSCVRATQQNVLLQGQRQAHLLFGDQQARSLQLAPGQKRALLSLPQAYPPLCPADLNLFRFPFGLQAVGSRAVNELVARLHAHCQAAQLTLADVDVADVLLEGQCRADDRIVGPAGGGARVGQHIYALLQTEAVGQQAFYRLDAYAELTGDRRAYYFALPGQKGPSMEELCAMVVFHSSILAVASRTAVHIFIIPQEVIRADQHVILHQAQVIQLQEVTHMFVVQDNLFVYNSQNDIMVLSLSPLNAVVQQL